MNEILQVVDLRKTYGDVVAVDGITFGIPEGSCFGLLGPNGAGKTTTIELMEGIIKPTSGHILFQGKPIDRRFREKVGIQFQSTALPEFITVRQTIELFRAFYEHPRSMDELIELCSLEDILKRDNRKLSGGQRQRMLLALAVIPKPDLIFLDEPTTGLDPQARRHFWELIRKIKSEGATILLTTHYMDEAQILCDEIAIMDRGNILERNSPDKLLASHFGGNLLRIPRPEDATEAARIGSQIAAAVAGGAGTLREQVVSWDILTDNLETGIKALLDAKVNLEGLSVHKPDLEDLFIKLTGSSLRV